MADSEVRQKFKAWYGAQPRCLGFPKCDGDLVGLQHSNGCPLAEIDDSGGCSTMTTPFDCYLAGMRAGEIARWIPVEEKLPEIGESVLVVTTPSRYVHDMKLVQQEKSLEWRNYFDHNRPEKYYWLDLADVTHWQPLPAAPEEKKP